MAGLFIMSLQMYHPQEKGILHLQHPLCSSLLQEQNKARFRNQVTSVSKLESVLPFIYHVKERKRNKDLNILSNTVLLCGIRLKHRRKNGKLLDSDIITSGITGGYLILVTQVTDRDGEIIILFNSFQTTHHRND